MRWLARLVAVMVVVLGASPAGAVLLGPSPYLQSADSPFSPFMGFTYFHLENFEDHLFNVPGVTTNPGPCVTSVCFGPSIHDSVDADDGVIDGSGLQGDSMFFDSGATGITFFFDSQVLGSLPTHAGIVWTDGAGLITFQAFDQDGNLLGTLVGDHADGSVNGETAEDRFYGVINAGGISRIFISNSGGGIEVDHLQYGFQPQRVPEPASLLLFGSGLVVLAGMAWRRRG